MPQTPERRREYRTKNKKRLAEYMREYRAKNKKRLAEQRREYEAKNKERRREYGAKNKERIAEQRREYKVKLSDGYVRSLITQASALTARDIPIELVELKRIQLIIEREVRNNERNSTAK